MTDNTGTLCTTPLGRIVWGHPVIPQQKTDEHNKKLFNDDGTPQMEVSYGLAIPKPEFEASVWPFMDAESKKGYPNGVPGKFSWKYTDGDGIDPKGKPYADRTGYAGCYVLAISTRFEAPPVMIFRDGAYYQTDRVKCGDYVTANLEFVVNVPKQITHTPSLYVNPKLTLLCYEGDEIKNSGPAADPTQVFGAAPVMPAAPAGARPVGAPPAGQPGGGMPGNASANAGQGMPQQSMGSAGIAAPGASGMPSPSTTATGMPGNAGIPPQQQSMAGGMPGANPAASIPSHQTQAVQAGVSAAPMSHSSPPRPTEPTHIHDNGNGTEQWFINGAWDGGAHPAPVTMPPPATGFVANAAGAGNGMPGQMPAR